MERIHQINNEIVNVQMQINEAKAYAERLPLLYQEIGRLTAMRKLEADYLKQQEEKNKTLEVNEDGNADICRSNDTACELPAHTGGTQQVSADE